MKLRVEGTKEETEDFAWKFRLNGLGFQIVQVSKFYPNYPLSSLDRQNKTGRLYIEIEPKNLDDREPSRVRPF